jgi:hypothetical protein
MFQSIHNLLLCGVDLLPFLGHTCASIFNYLQPPRFTFIFIQPFSRLSCSITAGGLPYIKTVLPYLARLNNDHQAMRHTSMLHLHFHTHLTEPRTSSTTGRGSNIYASLFWTTPYCAGLVLLRIN